MSSLVNNPIFTRKRFTLIGKVTNNTLDKTVTVAVVQKLRHPIYQKTVSRTKKYLVHDAKNICQINDQILIANMRKISKRKSFFVVKILKLNTNVATNKESEKKDYGPKRNEN